MGEPIRILIPRPDEAFRITLVSEQLAYTRDATPEDIRLAGYVPLSAFVGPLDLLSPPTLEGALEAIAELKQTALTVCRDTRAIWEKRALVAERERDEAQADAKREHDDYNRAFDAVVASLGARSDETVEDAAARAARERDEARRDLALSDHRGESVEQERARCVAYLRIGAAHMDTHAERAALSGAASRIERGEHAGTPVHVPEPRDLPRATDEELGAVYSEAYNRPPRDETHGAAHARSLAAVAARVRAEREPVRDMPLATDEELEAVFRDAFSAGAGIPLGLRPGIRAVAARVRREQCLVTQAVEAGIEDVVIYRERPGGTTWGVRVDERKAIMQAPADVPATLARLLGDVTRG